MQRTRTTAINYPSHSSFSFIHLSHWHRTHSISRRVCHISQYAITDIYSVQHLPFKLNRIMMPALPIQVAS